MNYSHESLCCEKCYRKGERTCGCPCHSQSNPTPTSACKCGHDELSHYPLSRGYPCLRSFCPCLSFQPSDPAPAKVSLPVNQWPDGKPPAPAKEEKCSKHGVVHKNGGYPSCAPSPSIEEIAWEHSLSSICDKHGLSISVRDDLFREMRIQLASIEKAGYGKGVSEGYMEGHEEAVMEAASEVMKARQGVEDFRAAAIKAVEELALKQGGDGKHQTAILATVEVIETLKTLTL